MKRFGRSMILAAIALCLAIPPAFAGEETIEEMVAHAATAADHEAVASYFERQAADAEAKAAQHERLAGVYTKKGSKGLGKQPMKEHCEKLAKRYRSDSVAYRSMAEAHRNAPTSE